MESGPRISPAVLARYATDAAHEVPGVRGVVERSLPRRGGVRVSNGNSGLALEMHLSLDWGASIPAVAQQVQARVADYLAQTTNARPVSVDVVVDQIGPR